MIDGASIGINGVFLCMYGSKGLAEQLSGSHLAPHGLHNVEFHRGMDR